MLTKGASAGVRCLAVLAAAAILCLPLLPPAHVHRAGVEGRLVPLTHAHQVEPEDLAPTRRDDSLAPPHGGHGAAIFLTTAVNRESSPAIDALLAPAGLPGTPPASRVWRTERGPDAALVTGPPPRPWLTRGPPARRA
jgi:hypothetical protein